MDGPFCGNSSNKYVIISASRTESGTESGTNQDERNDNESRNVEYVHYRLDLTKEDSVIKLFGEIKNKYGRLDVLINTIGGSLYSMKLIDFPLDKFNEVLTLNLTTAFLLTREAIKLMSSQNKSNKTDGTGDNAYLSENKGGNIIHFVSSSAKKFSHNKAPYGISKAGLARLIQYAAFEASESGIFVNGISPTYIFTPRHENDIKKKMAKNNISREKVIAKITESQLIKKPMYPDDLIPLVELLSNTKSITGQIINCTLGEVINY